jgi:hypothetical protein
MLPNWRRTRGLWGGWDGFPRVRGGRIGDVVRPFEVGNRRWVRGCTVNYRRILRAKRGLLWGLTRLGMLNGQRGWAHWSRACRGPANVWVAMPSERRFRNSVEVFSFSFRRKDLPRMECRIPSHPVPMVQDP